MAMQVRIVLPSACSPLPVVGQDHDRVCPADPSPTQNHFVGGVSLDDVNVVERRVVLLVGEVDQFGLIVDNHHRSLVGDDLRVDLANPGQAALAPVAQDQVIFHLEIRHVPTPKVSRHQDRGHRPGEQTRQPNPQPQQHHRQQPAGQRPGLRLGTGEQENPDIPERVVPVLELGVAPALGPVNPQASREPDNQNHGQDSNHLVATDRQV